MVVLFTVTFCANPANDLTCPPSYISIENGSQLSSTAYALLYLAQIIYAAVVLGVAFVFDWQGVTTVRVSAAISAPLCAVLFSLAFFLLQSRLAAQSIPPHWWVVREGEKAALLEAAAAANAPEDAAADPAGTPSEAAAVASAYANGDTRAEASVCSIFTVPFCANPANN